MHGESFGSHHIKLVMNIISIHYYLIHLVTMTVVLHINNINIFPNIHLLYLGPLCSIWQSVSQNFATVLEADKYILKQQIVHNSHLIIVKSENNMHNQPSLRMQQSPCLLCIHKTTSAEKNL